MNNQNKQNIIVLIMFALTWLGISMIAIAVIEQL